MTHLSLKKYQQTSKASAEDANPYQLVALLFQSLLGNIASAKGAIEQNNIEKKGTLISKSISIISVLEGSLDFSQGGDVSENLAALYRYCNEKLIQANLENNQEALDEVLKIILEIKSGWDAIPQEEHNKVSF